MEWKVPQKTDGKKARAETTVVIPPSPDVLCAGGDAQQKKRPPPPPSPEARSAGATRPDIPDGLLLGRRSSAANQRRPAAAQPLPSRCSDTHLMAGLSLRKRGRTRYACQMGGLVCGSSAGWKEPAYKHARRESGNGNLPQWRNRLVVASMSHLARSRLLRRRGLSSPRLYRAVSPLPLSWCCKCDGMGSRHCPPGPQCCSTKDAPSAETPSTMDPDGLEETGSTGKKNPRMNSQ